MLGKFWAYREPNCGYNTSSTRTPKNLTSPNYPKFYDSQLTCHWYIEADDENDVIKLTIVDIDIESGDESTNWLFDNFEIEPPVRKENKTVFSVMSLVFNNNRMKLRKARANVTLPLSYFSAGSTAFISFRSDMAFAGRGFKLIYQSVPKNKTNQAENGTDKHTSKKSRNKRSVPKEITTPSRTKRDLTFQRRKRADDPDHDGKMNQYYNLGNDGFYDMYAQSELSDYSDFRRAALLPNEMVIDLGHQEYDFIVQCSYDGKGCNRRGKDFITYQDAIYGNCFSFNSVR